MQEDQDSSDSFTKVMAVDDEAASLEGGELFVPMDSIFMDDDLSNVSDPISHLPEPAAEYPSDMVKAASESNGSALITSEGPFMTGRPAYQVYLSCDARGQMTDYQILLRKQLEVFEAGPYDLQLNAQGRNKPIQLGQVGLRCMHCARLAPNDNRRRPGGVYYPSKLDGVYQMAVGIAHNHFLCADDSACRMIPRTVRQELIALRQAKQFKPGTGKQSWGKKLAIYGVYEDQWGLRYAREFKGCSLRGPCH